MTRQIPLEHPLRKAASDGLRSYQPIFQGELLQIEAEDAEVSLNNLIHILTTGAHVTWVEVVESGHVYVAFDSGESYLATGFAIQDSHSLMTKCFAEFMNEATGGTDAEKWLASLLLAYGPKHRGGITLVPGLNADTTLRILSQS